MSTADLDVMREPGCRSLQPRSTVSPVRSRLTGIVRRFARHAAVDATPTVGMVRMITLLAVGLAAFTMSAALPISWLLAARSGLRAELEGRAHTYAAQMEREASQNPPFWNALAGNSGYSGLEGMEIARRFDTNAQSGPERRRVFSSAGKLLIDVSPGEGSGDRPRDATGEVPREHPTAQPTRPLLTAAYPIMDGTTTLGRVEIARSLRPALLNTAVVGVTSGCLGILMFLLLRVVPLRMLNSAIDHASFVSAHDLLTGLPNRRLFRDRLEQALAGARRYGGQNSRCFTLISTTSRTSTICLVTRRVMRRCASWPAGCALACGTAQILSATTGRRRVRGDPADARLSRGRHRTGEPFLLEAIAAPVDLGGQFRTIGLSVGIAITEPGSPSLPEPLMKQADMALYRAKGEGRGRFCVYTAEMDVRLRERHAMETDLRRAIAEHSLTVYYQPQVDLETGRVLGAEALLRWNRPGHGMTAPDRFIPLAEDTGLIVPIGLWVLREACLRAVSWPDDVSIAVNVSPLQFRRSDFCQAIMDTISSTGIAPSRVELEITEGVLLRDTNETLDILRRLREFGHKAGDG